MAWPPGINILHGLRVQLRVSCPTHNYSNSILLRNYTMTMQCYRCRQPRKNMLGSGTPGTLPQTATSRPCNGSIVVRSSPLALTPTPLFEQIVFILIVSSPRLSITLPLTLIPYPVLFTLTLFGPGSHQCPPPFTFRLQPVNILIKAAHVFSCPV